MIPLPKPRSFWDYALFTVLIAGLLLLSFWLEASRGVGWADAVFALAASAVLSTAIPLARRGEKAAWVARPSVHAWIVIYAGIFVFMVGCLYADAYFLHREDITTRRLRHDAWFFPLIAAGLIWAATKQFRRRKTVGTGPNAAS